MVGIGIAAFSHLWPPWTRSASATSGGAPLIVAGFRRVRSAARLIRRRSNGKGRIQSALASVACQKRQREASRHATPCNAGRAGAHRPSEALHAIRSSDVLTRIAWERVLPRHRCENASIAVPREPPQHAIWHPDRSNPFSCSAIRRYSRSRPEF